LGGFIAVDFCFYWAHRGPASFHNLLWGAHQPTSLSGTSIITALRKVHFELLSLAVYCP
jgi:hypothetical protein